MKIRRISGMSDPKHWAGWHVLTVAEAGFSMLDVYGRGRYGLTSVAITRFAESVNTSNGAGSLHPHAPISAVPQKFFRDFSEVKSGTVMNEFTHHVTDFIRANETRIRASRVLVEFHVSTDGVPEHYLDAAEEVFKCCPETSVLLEVVLAA